MTRGLLRGMTRGALMGGLAGLACLGWFLLSYERALHHAATPAGAMYGPGELAWFLSFPFGLAAAYGLGSLLCCGSGTVWHVIIFGVVVLNFVVIGAIAGSLWA